MGQLDQFHKHRWPKPDYWQRNPKNNTRQTENHILLKIQMMP